MKSRGLFIVFEGLDGSGKDTVLDALASEFTAESGELARGKYCELLRTREPTSLSPQGKIIQKKLADGSMSALSALNAAGLYIGDRKHHCKFLKTVISRGAVVLSSRYDLSTYAYQSVMGASFEELRRMHGRAVLRPDVTLLFKLNADEALRRVGSRASAPEAFEKADFLMRTEKAYIAAAEFLMRKEKRNIIFIDASESRETVLKKSRSALAAAVKKLK